MIWGAYLYKNLGGTLLAICDLGILFAQKFTWCNACDLGFGELTCLKSYWGHCLRFVIWVNLSVQQLMGDPACDLIFGKFIYPKTYGGHCLRFVVLRSLVIKKLKGDTACDL